MADRSSPINIATQLHPISPRNQTSNLTSALQSTTGNELRPSSALSGNNGFGKSAGGGRHDSAGTMSGLGPYYGSGAQPISMNTSNRPRRESVAGSLVNGMSWGGVSVSSWIRDDIIMQGTSPFAYQSPSYHSSSYLPKLEANFMRDFNCCGVHLPTMHDLLQHFEEVHPNSTPQPTLRPPIQREDDSTYTKQPSTINASSIVQSQTHQHPQQQHNSSSTSNQPTSAQFSMNELGIPSNHQHHPNFKAGEFAGAPLQLSQDMDDVADMEMDDITGFSPFQQTQYPSQNPQVPPHSQFGRHSSSRVPPLDLDALNLGNPLHIHQGLRNSQPTTPVSGGRPGTMYQNNPIVSSVNTPTFSAHPLHQQAYRHTPDSSAPGTPRELDPDFIGVVGNMAGNNNQALQGQQYAYDDYGYNNADMQCIDEPGKRLFSPGGLNDSHPSNQNRLGGAQYGPNSEIAVRIREQQRAVGLADTVNGLNGEEPKPFRCPVIGCEKAYKNQNGLKYHKGHGHNNQHLKENNDGTFSIVDPTTSAPYPGTMGMEKEKPYKCEKCGKRYKNLNGLKYHKQHSPPCNPDLKLNVGMPRDTTMHTLNARVTGVGLPEIGEEMML